MLPNTTTALLTLNDNNDASSPNRNVSPTGYHSFMPVNLCHLHHINEYCVAIASFILNVILAYVVLTERNATLKVYSHVLLQNCISDLCFTAASFITGGQMEFQDGYFIFVVNSLLRRWPIGWHYFSLFLYMMTVAWSIHVTPVIFYFRYTLICKGVQLSVFKLARFTMALFLPVFSEILSLAYATYLSEERRPELCLKLFWEDVPADDDPPGCRRPSPLCVLSRLDNVFMWNFVASAIVTDIVSYSIMFYCAYHIYQAMQKSKDHVSMKTLSIQRQMNCLLFVQMFLPLLTGIIPSVMMVSLMLFKVREPGMGIIVTLLFAWVPIVNPLTTLIFVKSFRIRFIKTIFRQSTTKTSSVANDWTP